MNPIDISIIAIYILLIFSIGIYTKRYISEVVTWSVNKAKWKAATEFCKDYGWEFMLITEKELKV